MIKEFLLLVLLIISLDGITQSEFTNIDKNSKSIPDSLTNHVSISSFLTQNLKTDREKIRSIYIWISHNIKYDLNRVNSARKYDSPKDLIDEVFTSRQGVCQHYSELFYAMCTSRGIKSNVISGYTKQSDGKISDLSHTWNSVLLDSNYYFIDVTWAAGYVKNNKYIHKFRDNYFLIEPREFIKTHIPFDPIWQFLDNPMDNEDFTNQDFSKLSIKGRFMYRDSIAEFIKLDKLAQLEQSNDRIINSGVTNKLIQYQINENLLQITNTKYNLAIDTLNYGIDNYNVYIMHKNRQFRSPKLADSQVIELITNAESGFYQADRILYGLFSDNEALNEMIIIDRNRIPELRSYLEKEKEFVDRYLRKWKPLRIFMFLTYNY